MNALDCLEQRIAALEQKILPKNPNFTTDDKMVEITDLLLQTQTMISSALSCREAITSILAHMDTINEFLDPSSEENELEVEAKRHYLLELFPELKDTVKLISTFENLTPYANSESILKLTELTDKLESLAVSNLKIFEESKEVTHKTVSALQKYNDIISSIKILFSHLHKAVFDLELALLPKFVTEE